MSSTRIFTFLQARMGSGRLPGKVLRPIGEATLLEHAISRLRKITGAELVVVTSELAREQPLIEEIERLGVEHFRGSEDDVLDRFYRAACKYSAEVVVRATADNPLPDIESNQAVIAAIGRTCGYAHTTGMPIGTNAEAFSFDSLERSWRLGTRPHHREHVNEYCLENPSEFGLRIISGRLGKRYADLRLTVDSEADLTRLSGEMLSIRCDPLEVTVDDIVRKSRIATGLDL